MSKLTGTITGNAIAMFFQAFASTFILFFLYLYINRILGLDKLGVWSVVMAITAGSRIIDIGFSVAVTKFGDLVLQMHFRKVLFRKMHFLRMHFSEINEKV